MDCPQVKLFSANFCSKYQSVLFSTLIPTMWTTKLVSTAATEFIADILEVESDSFGNYIEQEQEC